MENGRVMIPSYQFLWFFKPIPDIGWRVNITTGFVHGGGLEGGKGGGGAAMKDIHEWMGE